MRSLPTILGVIFGGLGLMAAIIAIVQASWLAKDIYEEVTKLQSEITEFDKRLDEMKYQTARFESIKAEIEAIEQRILNQDTIIENANLRTESQVREQTSALDERLNTVENALKNTPTESAASGVTIRKVNCIPLNERILVTGPKSYDFCDSEWVLQISSVVENGITMGTRTYFAPDIIRNRRFMPKGCSLQLLGIDAFNAEFLQAEVRGSCGAVQR